MPIDLRPCTCGHTIEEHNPRNGTCEVEGCLCACYEPEEEGDAD